MKCTLLFGVHGHQPVGNFDTVVSEAHEKCYRPYLQTLHRFPDFRFSVHFSGWLLEWLLRHYPSDMEVLKDMVARGQAELFGSGHYEPVLSSIPMEDRIGQVVANADFLEREFGVRPEGAWLTERVWEAGVVPALCAGGIRYAMVDDYHFLCAGKTRGEMDGYHLTEESGRTLALFPISEQLRYLLPFTPAQAAVQQLEERAVAGHKAAVYFDDIEKFGIWPETWEWVYGKRWLEQFLEAVLASPRLETSTYRDFHAGSAAGGLVYLPTVSYAEMNEWSLPAEQAQAYAAVLRREQEGGHLSIIKPFLRGGSWRNFLSKYPESNWMHKRMLDLSRRVQAVHDPHLLADVRSHLYAAQANDAYWHGLFGGLYLPHLRRAVWKNLIELEAALDSQAAKAPVWRGDLDLDGAEEVLAATGEVKMAFRLDGYAAIHELDHRGLGQNFGDTLRRYPQGYFAKFLETPEREGAQQGIASAHDRVLLKDRVTPEDLIPDRVPRVILLDYAAGPGGERKVLNRYKLVSLDEWTREAVFAAEQDGCTFEKKLCLDGSRVTAHYRLSGILPQNLSIEINLAMPSCDGYSGRYILENGDMPCGFGQALDLERCTTLRLDDRSLGGGVRVEADPPAAVTGRPHHTVSQSEAGLEKIMQAACVTLAWPMAAANTQLTVVLEPYRDAKEFASDRPHPSEAGVPAGSNGWAGTVKALWTRMTRH